MLSKGIIYYYKVLKKIFYRQIKADKFYKSY